jgi:hypothetical protein
MAMQTPAILRPKMGRTSGLPCTACAVGTPAPHDEQNRALTGNWVPQR